MFFVILLYATLNILYSLFFLFFFQAEDGIRDFCLSRGLGDVYKRQVTAASGAAMNENTTAGLTRSQVRQNYLEASNVQVADEMVNMIIAQRAYQLNSKAITTSDEMLEMANNLKR